MRSYAHVVVIAASEDEETFNHVAAPGLKLKMRSIAKICSGKFNDLSGDELCFVVRPEVPEGMFDDSIFSLRAEACLGFTFDYMAASSNCETFANGVIGRWTETRMVSLILMHLLTPKVLQNADRFIFSSPREQSRGWSMASQEQLN